MAARYKLSIEITLPTGAKFSNDYVEPGSKYEDIAYQTQSLELIADYMRLGIEPAALGTIDSDRWMRMAQ